MKKKLFLYFILLTMLFGVLILSCLKKQQESAVPSAMFSPFPAGSAKISALRSGFIADRIIRSAIKRTLAPGQPTPRLPDNPLPNTITLDKPDSPGQKVILDKSGNNYPFLMEKTPVLFPFDYKIGLLQELAGKDQEQQSIIALLDKFFKELMKGNTEKELLLKENSANLQSFLKFSLKKPGNVPVKVRIGKIAVKQGTAQINARLYSAKGVTEGEVFVIKAEDNWYVSDLQMNFDLLDTPYQDAKEKFMPASYYWILNNK